MARTDQLHHKYLEDSSLVYLGEATVELNGFATLGKSGSGRLTNMTFRHTEALLGTAVDVKDPATPCIKLLITSIYRFSDLRLLFLRSVRRIGELRAFIP
jgi:hypothetical protein